MCIILGAKWVAVMQQPKQEAFRDPCNKILNPDQKEKGIAAEVIYPPFQGHLFSEFPTMHHLSRVVHLLWHLVSHIPDRRNPGHRAAVADSEFNLRRPITIPNVSNFCLVSLSNRCKVIFLRTPSSLVLSKNSSRDGIFLAVSCASTR